MRALTSVKIKVCNAKIWWTLSTIYNYYDILFQYSFNIASIMFRTCTYADLFGVNLFQQFRKKILGKNQYPFHLSPPAIHYLTKEKYLN